MTDNLVERLRLMSSPLHREAAVRIEELQALCEENNFWRRNLSDSLRQKMQQFHELKEKSEFDFKEYKRIRDEMKMDLIDATDAITALEQQLRIMAIHTSADRATHETLSKQILSMSEQLEQKDQEIARLKWLYADEQARLRMVAGDRDRQRKITMEADETASKRYAENKALAKRVETLEAGIRDLSEYIGTMKKILNTVYSTAHTH